MKNPGTLALRWSTLTAAVFVFLIVLLIPCWAQENSASQSGNMQLRELDSQVREPDRQPGGGD